MSEQTFPPPAAAPVCARDSCDKPLTPSRGATPRKWCSHSCRQRAYEARRLAETVAMAMETARQQERAAARRQASHDASGDASQYASRDAARPVAPRGEPRMMFSVTGMPMPMRDE